MYPVDLHTHSKASDGQYRPSDLVKLAKEKEIQVLALTDHDTLNGLDEAATLGRELGVHVLPGIEMSAREFHTFHILGYGYGISEKDSPLTKMCQNLQNGRDDRALRIIDYLKEKSMAIELEELRAFADGGVIGRPHFARLMVDKGYISNYREAFDLYLDTDEYHARIENKPPVHKCMESIKASGGKVSLAHPYQIGLDNDQLDSLVKKLMDMGLDAIECYYPRHTVAQTTFYLELAKKYGLHVTGGSDFHGEKVKPNIDLAQLDLELDWLLEK